MHEDSQHSDLLVIEATLYNVIWEAEVKAEDVCVSRSVVVGLQLEAFIDVLHFLL